MRKLRAQQVSVQLRAAKYALRRWAMLVLLLALHAISKLLCLSKSSSRATVTWVSVCHAVLLLHTESREFRVSDSAAACLNEKELF